MKKNLLFIVVTLLSCQLFAQFIQKDNHWVGFGQFVLGDPMSKFAVSPPLQGGKYSKDNHEFSIYAYVGEPVEIAATRFNTILMTFNDSNRLVSFSLLKFYLKNNDPGFEKKAKQVYKKVIDYATVQLKGGGKTRTYYNDHGITDKGQEWAGPNFFLRIKKTYSVYQSAVELSFSYPGIQ